MSVGGEWKWVIPNKRHTGFGRQAAESSIRRVAILPDIYFREIQHPVYRLFVTILEQRSLGVE